MKKADRDGDQRDRYGRKHAPERIAEHLMFTRPVRQPAGSTPRVGGRQIRPRRPNARGRRYVVGKLTRTWSASGYGGCPWRCPRSPRSWASRRWWRRTRSDRDRGGLVHGDLLGLAQQLGALEQIESRSAAWLTSSSNVGVANSGRSCCPSSSVPSCMMPVLSRSSVLDRRRSSRSASRHGRRRSHRRAGRRSAPGSRR